MGIGQIITALASILGPMLFGGFGGSSSTNSAATMDPQLRDILLGRSANPTTGDPGTQGILQLQATQAQRADPLHANIIKLAQALMPNTLLGNFPNGDPRLGGSDGTGMPPPGSSKLVPGGGLKVIPNPPVTPPSGGGINPNLPDPTNPDNPTRQKLAPDSLNAMTSQTAPSYMDLLSAFSRMRG